MKTRLGTIRTCAALAIGMLMGCDNVKAPPAVRGDLLGPGAYPQITTTDGLDRGLVIPVAPVVDAGDRESRPMSVSVPVRNVAEKPLWVQYRFEFYDAKRHLLTKEERWVSARLEPRIEQRMEGNAMDADAVDYRLVIRPRP